MKHFVMVTPMGVALPEFFFQEGQRLIFRSRETLLAQRVKASRATALRHKSANRRSRSAKRIL